MLADLHRGRLSNDADDNLPYGSPDALDARAGEIACSSGGVVCTTQSINVQQEYVAPAPAAPAALATAGVRGVPAALVAALQAPVVGDDAFARSRHIFHPTPSQ